jgi:hypothetical protein
MSDLVFNHSQVCLLRKVVPFRDLTLRMQHDALLKTSELTLQSRGDDARAINAALDPEPCLLVFYTHHRPHLAERDLEFFRKASARGWVCVEIITEKFPVSSVLSVQGRRSNAFVADVP